MPNVSSDWSAKQTFSTLLRLGMTAEMVTLQVYPNPFSSPATISFSLPQDAHTTLELFDLAGRNIETVLDANLLAGDHHVALNRGKLCEGIYLLKLTRDRATSTTKIIAE